MNLKLIIAVAVLAGMPTLALAQASGAAPPKGQAAAPKPTKAAADKVVQIISADKAKIATYCAIGSLYEQMDQAREKKNQKQMQDLSKQIQALSREARAGIQHPDGRLRGGRSAVQGGKGDRCRV
jgi:hypothetical protein